MGNVLDSLCMGRFEQVGYEIDECWSRKFGNDVEYEVDADGNIREKYSSTIATDGLKQEYRSSMIVRHYDPSQYRGDYNISSDHYRTSDITPHNNVGITSSTLAFSPSVFPNLNMNDEVVPHNSDYLIGNPVGSARSIGTEWSDTYENNSSTDYFFPSKSSNENSSILDEISSYDKDISTTDRSVGSPTENIRRKKMEMLTPPMSSAQENHANGSPYFNEKYGIYL